MRLLQIFDGIAALRLSNRAIDCVVIGAKHWSDILWHFTENSNYAAPPPARCFGIPYEIDNETADRLEIRWRFERHAIPEQYMPLVVPVEISTINPSQNPPPKPLDPQKS
jgi:hypothetical protein